MADTKELENSAYDNSVLSPAEGIKRLITKLITALKEQSIEEANDIDQILYCFRQHMNTKQLHAINDVAVKMNKALKDSVEQLEEANTTIN